MSGQRTDLPVVEAADPFGGADAADRVLQAPEGGSTGATVVGAKKSWLPFSPFHLMLFPLALLFVSPFIQMLFASMKTDPEIQRIPTSMLPERPDLTGYVRLFTETDILKWILNTTIVSSSAILGNIVLCSLAGYGFARLHFRGRNFSFMAMIATIMIPTQLLMIPTYIMFSRLGLINTLAAAALPWLCSAFGVFLMRQFFLSLPKELEEAARLDGCSQFMVFWRVVLPLARPALATLAVFTLLGSWNDLVWPLIAITDDRWQTLQLGLANFQGMRRTQWQLLMSGNVVSTLPLALFFLVAQKQFVATMTMSGMKG